MKTYPIEILRKAFFSLVDTKKYVRFTLYQKPFIAPFGKMKDKKIGGKPLKVKGKISNLFAGPTGLKISFTHCWINHNRYCFRVIDAILLKDIQWQTNPFNEEALEELCIKLIKKLETSKEAS